MRRYCKICLKRIFTKEEKYVVVADYNKEEKVNEGFFHIKCYVDRVNKPSTDIERQAKELLGNFGNIFGNLHKKEYEIK